MRIETKRLHRWLIGIGVGLLGIYWLSIVLPGTRRGIEATALIGVLAVSVLAICAVRRGWEIEEGD